MQTILGHDGELVADCGHTARTGFRTCEERDANTDLIAAAPGLLAALRLCKNTLGAKGGPTASERNAAIDAASAAIAKATGGAL